MERGSFWSKWIHRNKYWNLIRINIYEGYAGQALGAMTVRTYFMDNISGPDSNGNVTIQGKDILARIEERKAQAPAVSQGVLYADIDESTTSIEVANAVEADYDASGVIRIGDELISYSARATSTYGITFTASLRGYKNTVSAAHEFDDEVQQCVEYSGVSVDTVLEDLLSTYGGIDTGFLNLTDWATEAANYHSAVRLRTVIAEPTSVAKLVSEILLQVGGYMWWGERTRLVEYRAVRGIGETVDRIDDESNILPGFSIKRMPRQRISQCWFYYNVRSYVDDLEKPSNFNNSTIVANLESEADDLYGEPSIRKIFSRWLLTAAGANTTASRLVARYTDVPREATFSMDAKDRAYWTGDIIEISHRLDVDEFGNRNIARWTITSAEEIVPGEIVRYVAEDTTLYGITYFVQGTGAADYDLDPTSIGPTASTGALAYIGNSAGLLSDGTPSAKIG